MTRGNRKGQFYVPRKGRFKKACEIKGYSYPPKHIQKILFQEQFFYTDAEINELLKSGALFGLSFRSKTYLTVNPLFTWVWTQKQIDQFWKKN